MTDHMLTHLYLMQYSKHFKWKFDFTQGISIHNEQHIGQIEVHILWT
jgi:hypothetical protein